MSEDFWKLKIKAFLHDPPEKAIILMQEKGVSHEERAKELLREIIEDDGIEEVKRADTNASSADRINLPSFEKKFLDSPVIKHPLSGDGLDKINELSKTDSKAVVENAKTAVDKAIQEIKGECGEDPLKICLTLWRKLPDLIKNHSPNELRPFWSVLPADTRIPDHSIWNHRNATAAFAGGIVTLPASELNKEETIYNLSFLLFSLGPVQEFIATARKTQDLWMGSYILSYLSWWAMKAVVEEFGPDVIVFPDLYEQPLVDQWLASKIYLEQPNINRLSTPTLPNRFLAILPQMKEGKYQPSEIAQRTKESVISAWKEIAETVKKGLETKLGCKNQVWDKIWERQIGDFIETYWVAYDWKPNYQGVVAEYKSLIGTDESWEMGKLLSLYEDKSKSKYSPTLGTVYQLLYELTERSLGSRKAVRNFKQSEESNYKCTLCGVREPLHDGYKDLKEFWSQFADKGFREVRSKGKERLCAVCTTKRFAMRFYFDRKVFSNGNLGFPSVGTVATAAYQFSIVENVEKLRDAIQKFYDKVGGFLEKIEADSRIDSLPKIKKAVSEANDDIRRLLQEFIRIDGEWLYEESLNEDRLKKEYSFDKSRHGSEFKDAQEAADALRKEIKKLKIAKPSKYYAVLYIDGDNMGKWLSGELAPKITEIVHPEIKLEKDWNLKRPLSPALHSSISSALRNFSLKLVRRVVEEKYLGKLIYAGGDDVLAFVSLPDLLNVMRDLRAFYSGFIDENGNADFKKGNGFIEHDGELLLTMGKNATASMGVVIAHYLQPLNQVMNKVREMEKEAKKGEKNAFAISLMKRSGGTEVIKAKWYYDRDNRDFDTIEFIKELSDQLTNGALSTKFAYDFREKLKWIDKLSDQAIRSEVLRLIKRHSEKKQFKDDHEFDQHLRYTIEGLMRLRTELGKLEEVSKILSLAVFLSKQGSEGES
ncbi:MAG TPA: type III-B CRISPR-associated protein Cas10/Cmr2 [Thermodesulfobacteriota bacterium]|nr:type III-B CRISPR-associated protein Cas10/Cmr2 [Thermodesulfobacteriota bacterium]